MAQSRHSGRTRVYPLLDQSGHPWGPCLPKSLVVLFVQLGFFAAHGPFIHGADRVNTIASPDLGQHNKEIYSDWLGLTDAELGALYKEGVI